MRIFTSVSFLLTGLLLTAAALHPVAGQGLPARTMAFDAQGVDTATSHPIVIHLVGKSMMAKGRQYSGTCSIKPRGSKGPTSGLVGEWQFVQNSSAALAGGAQPAIAGSGARSKTKPLRAGQAATSAGQAINFTIEARPDGRYQILLMDAFSDESLEFISPATAGK